MTQAVEHQKIQLKKLQVVFTHLNSQDIIHETQRNEELCSANVIIFSSLIVER